jgi:hypothetical protein
MSIFFNPQEVKDEPMRPNEDFFKKEKLDQRNYPDPMVKQKSNEEHSDTDFISQPLLPSINQRKDNLHAMNFEKDCIRNKTTIKTLDEPIKKIGFEGKFL